MILDHPIALSNNVSDSNIRPEYSVVSDPNIPDQGDSDTFQWIRKRVSLGSLALFLWKSLIFDLALAYPGVLGNP